MEGSDVAEKSINSRLGKDWFTPELKRVALSNAGPAYISLTEPLNKGIYLLASANLNSEKTVPFNKKLSANLEAFKGWPELNKDISLKFN